VRVGELPFRASLARAMASPGIDLIGAVESNPAGQNEVVSSASVGQIV